MTVSVRCVKGNPRLAPRERLLHVDIERVATKLARDFAKNVSRVTVGAETLPANHSGLRARLREAIADELLRAREQA